jgi:hypothetical protein
VVSLVLAGRGRDGIDHIATRVKVLRTVVETLSKELGFEPTPPGQKPRKAGKRNPAAPSLPDAGTQARPAVGAPGRAKKDGTEQKPGKTDPGMDVPGKSKKIEKK